MTEFAETESSQLLACINEADDAIDKLENEEGGGEEGLANTEVNGSNSRDSEAPDENIETYSESNSTAISHHKDVAKDGRSGSQFVRAEPLSAKQQVALWLTRTSTQELYNELNMSRIKNWVVSDNKYRTKQPLCGASSSRLQNPIHRNFSTKSLMEASYSHFQDDANIEENPMRKCETVLALSDEPFKQKKMSFNKSKSKVSLCTSRMSFLKRSSSKCHSEIMTSHIHQHPANFPGIRPTNRLR